MDFGEGKRVVGRKGHRCAACCALIPRGERHYHYSGMYGGDWQNWRMHEECYAAYEADGCEEFVSGDYPVPPAVVERLERSQGGQKQ
jgi:hypothetical protein